MAETARLPVAMPTPAAQSSFAGLSCRIDGSVTPILSVTLSPGQLMLLNPACLLWKEASMALSLLGEALLQAEGPGSCGVGQSGPGMIFPIPLHQGDAVQIEAGRFLVCAGVEMQREHVQGLGDRLVGGAGFPIDRFTAGPGGGVVWVQADGDVFERALHPGEPLELRPGTWLCKDPSVQLEQVHPTAEQPADAALGRDGTSGYEWPCLRLTGPGRIALQTGSARRQSAPVPAENAAASPRRRGVAGTLLNRKQA